MALADNDALSSTVELPAGLLEQIVARLDPVRVILFGSRASGNIHRDSDWDLFVVVDDDMPNERINWNALYEARRGIRGAAIDIVPSRVSDFERRKRVIGSLPWIVTTEGLIVYERASKP